MEHRLSPVAGRNLPSVIGQGIIIKGSIRSRQDLFLDGQMEGDLDVGDCTLVIGPNGRVVASARARVIDIHGTITGNVESTEKTSIRTSGQLVGDVRTGGIVIESGALLKGKVEIVTRPRQVPEVTNGE